jgi:TatD DNase family protein
MARGKDHSRQFAVYIDSHAHLFSEDYKNDLDEVLQRTRDAGVTHVVVPGTDVATSRAAVAMAERIPWIFACVGIHPHDAAKATEADLITIEELAGHPKVVAIGEIGLDYYYDFSPRNRQQELLRAQLEIASRRSLPVVVHTRESITDTVVIVEDAIRAHPQWLASAPSDGTSPVPSRGVFHCFPGTSANARELRSLGFYISYPGIVTFKKSSSLVSLQDFGYRNILLETDSPYMSPVPLRGSRNEPANIIHIGRKIAETFGVPEKDVAAATTANAMQLFQLPTLG